MQAKGIGFSIAPGRERSHLYMLSDLLPHLPPEARQELQSRFPDSTAADLETARLRYERASRKSRDRVGWMYTVLLRIDLLVAQGYDIIPAILAVVEEGREEGRNLSLATVKNWRRRVRDLPRDDWPAALCHGSAAVRRRRFTLQHPFIARLYADHWGRPTKPSVSAAYRAMLARIDSGELPSLQGTEIPSEDTVRLVLGRELNPGTVLRARVGPKAQRRAHPSAPRDRSALTPYEVVAGDGHTGNWLVEWPDGTRGRPEITALVDEYSGFCVGWEIDRSESAASVRGCVAKSITEWGLPSGYLFDNGAGFAAKELTAGARNRHRGKEREGDVPGAITRLGIEVQFTLPHRPESKGRIERWFGLLEDTLAADHTLPEGACMGKAPHVKSEKAGSRAVPLAAFRAAVARAVEMVNRRESQGHNCSGRSPERTFHEDGYAKRTPVEPLRANLFLMPVKVVTPDRVNQSVRVLGNVYHDEGVAAQIRALPQTQRKVQVYYDPTPEGLHERPVWLATLDDRMLGVMPCVERTGYRDPEAAKRTAQGKRRLRQGDQIQHDSLHTISANVSAQALHRDPELAARIASSPAVTTRFPRAQPEDSRTPQERELAFLQELEKRDAAERAKYQRRRLRVVG
jgi:transposase InsO family protein